MLVDAIAGQFLWSLAVKLTLLFLRDNSVITVGRLMWTVFFQANFISACQFQSSFEVVRSQAYQNRIITNLACVIQIVFPYSSIAVCPIRVMEVHVIAEVSALTSYHQCQRHGALYSRTYCYTRCTMRI